MSKVTKMTISKFLPKIHKHELPKFFHTASLVLLIGYVHNTLRLSRDPLIMSYLGSEAFSAIKIWSVLPALIVFMFLYIKLYDIFTRSQLFHIISWTLLSYFILFAFVLYPNRDLLHISINETLKLRLPVLKYLFIIIENWSYCLFYVFSEIWVTVMLAISFWQIANHITSTEESKRFYFLFGLAAQTGLLLASLQTKIITTNNQNWQQTINYVAIFLIIAGILLSLSLNRLKNIVGHQKFNLKTNKVKTKKTSIVDSLKYITSSRPIFLMTMLVFSYTVGSNLLESAWKKSLEILLNKNLTHMQNFMSNIGICASAISITCAFSGSYLVRTYKWRTIALIAPVIAMVTGGIFYMFMIFTKLEMQAANITSYNIALISVLPALHSAVYFGALSTILTRSTKHTLSDITKEMVYIPLNDHLKTKGKAAAESIGSGFGKGFSSISEQGLLALTSSCTLITISPILAVIFLTMTTCWIYSIVNLDRWRRSEIDK